ncbi:MAG: hypothetical protein LBO05_13155 [Deltaproteobacteria bacterium]|nr:hypothetical protein [Deltaproteobacteria bacterium]
MFLELINIWLSYILFYNNFFLWMPASIGQKKYGSCLIKATENNSNIANYANKISILKKILAQDDFY